MTRGEIAAFASHFRLWMKCIELNEPIVIFEDDAILLPNFRESTELAEERIAKYGCIRLYGHRGGTHQTIETVDETYRIDFSRKGTLGSVAYMLDPNAAQKLVDNADEWIFGQDIYMNLSYLHKVGCVTLKPYCIKHSWENTTIEGRSGHNKTLFSKLVKELHVASIRIRSRFFEHSLRKKFHF